MERFVHPSTNECPSFTKYASIPNSTLNLVSGLFLRISFKAFIASG